MQSPELTQTRILMTQGKLANIVGSGQEVFRKEQVFRDILSESGYKYIDHASQRVIFIERTNDEEEYIYALDYNRFKSPGEATELFYTHKIMSTILPFNFPKIRFSYGMHHINDQKSGTHRARLIQFDQDKLSTLEQDAHHPFSAVEAIVEELKLPTLFDKSGLNFGKVDGNVYFLDTIVLDPERIWDTKAIMEYMDKHGYSNQEKRGVILQSSDYIYSNHKDKPYSNLVNAIIKYIG